MGSFVPLPSPKWARSARMPNWALCFDPDHQHYGWKMQSVGGRWVSGARLSRAELEQCRLLADLSAHHAEVDKLLAAAASDTR